MAKPGPAPRPRHLKAVEGNPGKRASAELEPGVQLRPEAPDEPDWLDWWPAVRKPTKKQLRERWPLEVIEGSLTHIEHDGKRARLAKARQRWLIDNEQKSAERARAANQRARDVAREEWRRVVPVLDAQGLLAVIDHQVLVEYCRTVARLDQCERDLSANGLWVQGERGAVKNPCATIANQLRGALKFYVGELGLSPVARDGMTTGGSDGEEGSPFD